MLKKWGLKKRGKDITDCKEVQKMVIPYINQELSDDELRRFVYHIENCAECREELEIYYIVYKGLMQLDENENLSMNIIEALNDELESSRYHLRNMTLFYTLSEIIQLLSVILSGALAVFLILQLI
ncbi:MAG: anti-sigma factor [Lachnospiraceae bacterium]